MGDKYKKGRRKEYDLRDLLREAGACEVARTAGSHGIFDLYSITPCGIRCIQVKSIDKDEKVSEAEIAKWREKIRESNLPKLANVSYEYMVWRDYEGWVKHVVYKGM